MAAIQRKQEANVPKLGTIVPNLGTMDETASLAEALFGRTRRLILGLLYCHPEERFYLRQMARTLGVGHGALQRELRKLATAGLILREATGKQVYYRANEACPIYADLQGVILKTVGLADVLRNALAALAERIQVAFVYGSIAKGMAKASSDVDLMIIGSVTFGEVAKALNPAQDILRREVNPSVYPADEVHCKIKAGHHFLRSVFDGPKIYLIGGEEDLKRVVETGVAD